MPGMEERSMMEKTIKKDIWEMISSVSYSTHIAGNAGRADQKFFEHLQEGIADNDLDKIYEFIDAYERGKSIKPDELVCRLFQKAYREDSARLCQLLAEKNNIVDYWIFLSTCCETDMLVDFAKMDVAYPCFYYECARILLKRTSGIDEKCKEAIIAAVKRIADRDLALWERWVQRKEHNTNWQQLLFSVLSKVSREALKRFAQTINLDMMLQNHKEDIVAWEFERLSDTSKKYILENISKDILDVYDMQLAEFGYNIIIDRLEYIKKLNKYSEKIHSDITSGKEKIEFKYTSTIKDLENIKESFYSLLEKNRARDCERGITSIGPHRDDFVVLINDIDTKSYGSQGQQRTAVLTIKFASLKIIKELTGEHPVLLLDDVLSELDFSRKRYILSTIGDIQTIITCTGIEDLYEYLDDKSKVFKVKDGEILN